MVREGAEEGIERWVERGWVLLRRRVVVVVGRI
jgi:hypothetical protein